MGEAAVALARAVGYGGAGTVEFLLDADGELLLHRDEHAAAGRAPGDRSACTGLDLVEWQLRVAAGERAAAGARTKRSSASSGGHAIEARLCAEDPAHDYLPQSRPHRALARAARRSHRPRARRRRRRAAVLRLDAGAAHRACADARRESLARLAAALDSTVCWGVTTNREFLARVLRDDAFGAGAFDTTFLARRFGDDAARSTAAPTWLEAIAAASLALLPRAPLPPLWSGWSSSPSIDTLVPVEIDGAVRRWHLTGSHESLDASCAASTHRIAGLSQRRDDGAAILEATVDGRAVRVTALFAADAGHWQADGSELAAIDLRLRGSTRAGAVASGTMVAPMHGRVTEACVEAGATVAAGALLVVIEAMKMEHQIRAPLRRHDRRAARPRRRPGGGSPAAGRGLALEVAILPAPPSSWPRSEWSCEPGRDRGSAACRMTAAASPAFEPEFVAGLTALFEERIPFNHVLGLRIDTLAAEGVDGASGDAARPDRPLRAPAPARRRDQRDARRDGRPRRDGGDRRAPHGRGAGAAAAPLRQARHDRPARRLPAPGRSAIASRCAPQVLRLGSRVATTRMEFADADGKLLATGSSAYIVS